jgi:hypothetical protein
LSAGPCKPRWFSEYVPTTASQLLFCTVLSAAYTTTCSGACLSAGPCKPRWLSEYVPTTASQLLFCTVLSAAYTNTCSGAFLSAWYASVADATSGHAEGLLDHVNMIHAGVHSARYHLQCLLYIALWGCWLTLNVPRFWRISQQSMSSRRRLQLSLKAARYTQK